MLLRYFLSTKGRISAGRYRAFLLWYFCGLIPVFILLLGAFLMIGGMQSSGLLVRFTPAAFMLGSSIYFLGALWPLVAATARRMHDLGYRNRDYFFMISPRRSWRLGKDMLFKRGEEKTNLFGPDPGAFEQ
jgi:uncharacterized membrane protein YhaH (DUF805 family)